MKFNHAIFLTMILFGCMLFVGFINTQSDMTYAQVFQVIEIENDVLHLVNWNGEEWLWEGAEDWEIGDFAAAIMNTNGTEIVYDDIIINLRYIRITAR